LILRAKIFAAFPISKVYIRQKPFTVIPVPIKAVVHMGNRSEEEIGIVMIPVRTRIDRYNLLAMTRDLGCNGVHQAITNSQKRRKLDTAYIYHSDSEVPGKLSQTSPVLDDLAKALLRRITKDERRC
jgi:hypothetical protein